MILEEKIYKKISKYFIVIFLTTFLIFSLLYYIFGIRSELNEFERKNDIFNDDFISCISKFENFLNDSENIYLIENSLNNNLERNMKSFYYKLYNVDKINFSINFFGENNELIFSVGKFKNNKGIHFFQKILDNNVKDFDISTYIVNSNKSILILTKKISNGFISIYIDDDDLNQNFKNSQLSYAITDKHDKIIIQKNNEEFIFSARKFVFNKDDNKDFNVKVSHYKYFNIYTKNYKTFSEKNYLIIFTMFMTISFVYIVIIRITSYKITKSSMKNLNFLIEKIRNVSSGKEELINLKTGDELEYISSEINDLVENIKNLSDKNIRLEYENKANEFKTMESQFNPHFLYNTLEMISITMITDPNLCNKIIQNLTKILRYSINGLNFVHLDEDLEYTKMYLEIEKIKMQEKFYYEINIDDKILNLMVPKLFLQPLIENSIKYSYENIDTLKLTINIYQKEESIFIEICDNGNKLSDKFIEELNKKIEKKSENSFFTDDHHGLENTLKRLKFLYHKNVKLKFVEDTNVKIIIEIDRKK
ncbi:MAG: histidine kinase [Peptoniphilaceae bacterium]|nr:histidine kinase [Peptoniphilaceae bacterium]MDD7383637.1 histidine kinase [Peptoniphilaceae bacterium]MDY3737808.1 histidine kinase [Peptoniphilaceae bacterium]